MPRDILEGAPEAMLRRPRDERGFPIPYAQFNPASGVDFRIIDREVVEKCIREERCGLCGESLGHWIWFIGGPACWPGRRFSDPPMHEACARYAAAVCPFIAGGRTLYSNRPIPEVAGVKIGHEPVMADHVRRPETMYLFKTRRYKSQVVGQFLYMDAAAFAEVWEVGGGRVYPEPSPP